MARAFSGIFVYIVIGGKSFTMEDLSAFKIDITDNEEGDNEISIYCNDADFKICDNKLFQLGQSVAIQWGYTGSDVSQERSHYVITKPSTQYTTDGVVTTLTASTKSVLIAARRPQKSYGSSTVKSIIQDIANRNKLTLEITGGNESVPAFSQGKRSDRECIRLLADRFGYVATYFNNTLIFAPRDFDQKSILTFKYARGEESDIISASVTQEHNKDKGDGELFLSHTPDPNDKKKSGKTQINVKTLKTVDLGAVNPTAHVSTVIEKVQAEADKYIASGLSTDGKTLTAKMEGFGAKLAQALSSSDIQWDTQDVKDIQSYPPTMDAAIKAMSSASALNAKHRKADMTVEVEGHPLLTARKLIEIQGLSKRDSGKWYIIKVSHKIDDQSGYTCSLDLARSGHNLRGSGGLNGNTNDSAAGKGKQKTPNGVKVDLKTGQVTKESSSKPSPWAATTRTQ